MSSLALRLAHRAPGRARLHSADILNNPAEAQRLATAAAALPGVSKCEARSTTGSLIIFHIGEWEPIASALAAALGAELAESPPDHQPHAMDSAGGLLFALDQATSKAFGRRTDLHELAFLGLIAAGGIQLARGKVLAPATTLLGQALSLMAAHRAGRRPG